VIEKICIENVKGFGPKRCFNLNIIPNKPSILVAPNGFGKSSLAAAFNSLNSNRMNLDRDHYYKNDNNNDPSLSLQYKNHEEKTKVLMANKVSNSVSKEFDCFVINNKVKAKAKQIRISGVARAVASMEIPPIILRKTIPQKYTFDYSISNQKKKFGINGKILSNISSILKNKNFLQSLIKNKQWLKRSLNITEEQKTVKFISDVNSRNGSITTIKDWIGLNEIQNLEKIQYFSNIANLIKKYNNNITNLVDCYLSAYQIIQLYKEDKDRFINVCMYEMYKLQKEEYINIFRAYVKTWKEIIPKKKKGSLLIELPKTHYISNGERDILTFLSLLQKAKNSFSKQNSILIIDEVFDYLDDANLIVVQYYITQLIEQLKSEGKNFYPIILTHLNPFYFRNFVFGNQKVYYLKSSTIKTNKEIRRIILNRDKQEIKDKLSKYFLHFHTKDINIKSDFKKLKLNEPWGESQKFCKFIDGEMDKYIANKSYCPYSVCIALRVKIEKNIFDLFSNLADKKSFLEINMTKNKLNYAIEKGFNVDEIYYLLGVIYNEVIHLKNYTNNNSPLVNKLDNIIIKNLIKEVFLI